MKYQLSAAVAISLLAAGCASTTDNIKTTATQGLATTCLFEEENSSTFSFSGVMSKVRKHTSGDSPLCSIADPVQRFGASRAALNKGSADVMDSLDNVYLALGLQAPFAKRVAELQYSGRGTNVSQLSSSSAAISSEEMEASIKELEEKLEEIKGQGYLSKEQLAYLADAQRLQTQATVNLVHGSAGVIAFGKWWNGASSAEKTRVLGSSLLKTVAAEGEKGFGSFLSELVDTAQTAANVVKLIPSIPTVAVVEDMARDGSEAEQNALMLKEAKKSGEENGQKALETLVSQAMPAGSSSGPSF